ncbi:MAG: helix-turn-helix domain-containing protein [Clostridia bacterium]|nr:helix-turn-helix domain-containing protein [Clostridia bacterium]
MITKRDILTNIHFEKNIIKKKTEEGSTQSQAYYRIAYELLERLEVKVENTRIFDAPEGYWAYSFEINSQGVILYLEYYNSVDFDENKNLSFSYIGETFPIITVKTRLLTVEEYARMYEVETVTVRQWIRRGKIRTAIKFGKEWRIPELTQVPSRGYRMGQYKWEESLSDLPLEYEFLNKYNLATLYQDDKDKNLYHVNFSKEGEESTYLTCNIREREKIEMILITNPLVTYISDMFGSYC